MRVLVIMPPEPVVPWADADAHLKLSGDEDERSYVEGLVAAATAHIDGPDGWLGRALGEQTLEARMGAYESSSRLRLPFPPLVELVSVKYLDSADVEQTVSLADVETLGSEVVPLGSVCPWERASLRREAIRIRYKAGYSGSIPAPIRVAILMMVGDMYRNRATTQSGTQSIVPMSTKVEDLLAPFQVYR